MRVFLTGSTGFVGAQVTRELLAAGHDVLGLTRSDEGERALRSVGAVAHRGNIEDLDSLRNGAEQCDAVIHTAFDHDFAHFVENCQKDARVIDALGTALQGSARPLVITSSVAMGATTSGQPSDEDHFDATHPHPRTASERAGQALSERGINVVVMRLSQIHNPVKQGLITYLIELARQKGVSAYVGEGQEGWSAAHLTDTARLYRLALEKHQPGARYNAVAEQGVAFRDIAQLIGEGLGVPTVTLTPEQATGHFGWMAGFAGLDMSASSTKTRERLGWTPTGPGLAEDLRVCLEG